MGARSPILAVRTIQALRLIAPVLLLAACASPRSASSRERPLGPFYDRTEAATGKTVQVRPFYYRHEDERGLRVNVLGPFVRYREDEVYRRLEIFPNVFYSARHAPEGEKSWWFMFFPFLYLGNDDFLVFPLGGYSHGILGLSELLLVTPFYARTRRISSHGTDPNVYTVHHVLFPLLAWGSDGKEGGRRKLRIAPFYGRTVHRDGGTSGFVLWPFYSWRHTDGEDAVFLFPFYGRRDRATSRETTVMFPFYIRREDFLTGSRDISVWPFWRRAGGSDALEAHRYWPLAGWERVGSSTEEFAAWPFWRRAYRDDGREFSRGVWVAPFYRHVTRFDRETHALSEKRVLWPFYRKERMAGGGTEFSIPSLLPTDSPSVQELVETFRPFGSLYFRRTAPNGDRETSALFGLYMARREGESRKVRLLGGLLGWDRGPEERSLRLLWGIRLRLGGSR